MAGRSPVLEVDGLRSLRRDLKAAGVSLADLKDAHAQVAQLVLGRATAPHRTGALAASQRGSGTQSAAVVRAGSAARVPYANAIHWGWGAHHIKAQPWLYDAAVASQQEWTGVYLHALEQIIDSIEGAPGP
jgi:hypothetical protein